MLKYKQSLQPRLKQSLRSSATPAGLDVYEKVYKVVRKIPKGKVSTYGAIGKKLNMSPRVIGQALHANPYEGDVPCHRVVNRDGRIAPNFAFGGKDIQRKLLEAEGVTFKDTIHANLQEHFIDLP